MNNQTMEMQSPRIEDFPFQATDTIRYVDTDRQGHVNNAVFASFLETGRVHFLYDAKNALATDSTTFVIAKLELNFIAELNWPGKVLIGTGVVGVGNSSLRLFQGLFQDGQLVATATTVIVQMNEASRKSHPLSATAREFLQQNKLPER
jgi:acyl-CoA thioester hydrolase